MERIIKGLGGTQIPLVDLEENGCEWSLRQRL